MWSTPSSSFPSSDQYLVNLVAFPPFQLFRADLAEGTETTGRCHGGINRTHNTLTGCCLALTSASPRLCPLCVRPMRSPWGPCSNCTSAEVETDRTPVCFMFVFHSSFAVNTACAPFEALIRDWFSAQIRTGKGVETKIFMVRLCEGQESSLPFYLWALHMCSSRRMCREWQWADHMVYLWTFAWITSKYHLI